MEPVDHFLLGYAAVRSYVDVSREVFLFQDWVDRATPELFLQQAAVGIIGCHNYAVSLPQRKEALLSRLSNIDDPEIDVLLRRRSKADALRRLESMLTEWPAFQRRYRARGVLALLEQHTPVPLAYAVVSSAGYPFAVHGEVLEEIIRQEGVGSVRELLELTATVSGDSPVQIDMAIQTYARLHPNHWVVYTESGTRIGLRPVSYSEAANLRGIAHEPRGTDRITVLRTRPKHRHRQGY